MTMVRTRLLLLLATLAASATGHACSFGTGPSAQERLEGTWSWVESTGGIAGLTSTPASTGDSVTLLFTLMGEVSLFRNGSLERTVGFSTARSSGSDLEIRYDEPLMGFETQTATFPNPFDLVLTDPCCDGFVSRYARSP